MNFTVTQLKLNSDNEQSFDLLGTFQLLKDGGCWIARHRRPMQVSATWCGPRRRQKDKALVDLQQKFEEIIRHLIADVAARTTPTDIQTVWTWAAIERSEDGYARCGRMHCPKFKEGRCTIEGDAIMPCSARSDACQRLYPVWWLKEVPECPQHCGVAGDGDCPSNPGA